MSVAVRWLPSTERWRPDRALLDNILEFYAELDVPVVVWPRTRQNIDDLFPDRHMGFYDVRAVSRGDGVHLLVDGTETSDSTGWLLAHELAHQLLARHPDAKRLMNLARSPLDPAGDFFHEEDPEERFADGLATRLLTQARRSPQELRYDRAWWRQRTSQVPSRDVG